MLKSAFLVLFVTCLLSSCATTRFPKWDAARVHVEPAGLDEAAQLEKEGDRLYSERKSLPKLLESTMKWELAVRIAPSVSLFSKLSRAHYLYAQRTAGNFEKGLSFAEEGLKFVAPEFIDGLAQGLSYEKALRKAPSSSGHLLYWYAMSLEKWSQARGVLTTARYKEAVRSTMSRALEIENDVEVYAQISDTMKDDRL